MAPTSSSFPSASSSLFLDSGLRVWLIHSVMSLSRFSLSEVLSYSFTSSQFATPLYLDGRNYLDVAAAAAALVPFRVSVILKSNLNQ